MKKDEAIKVLGMVEAHGLANKAKEIAIEALKTEAIPVSWLEDFRDNLDMLSERWLMNAIDLLIMAYRVERKREEDD